MIYCKKWNYYTTKVGKKIADGGDRKVYRYGDDKVIKFSSLAFLVGKKLRLKYTSDYLVCKKYLGDCVVETIDVSNGDSGRYVEIQDFIEGEMLSKKHTKNPYIKSQVNDIANILNKMKNDDSPIIDLVGNTGMIKPCLSNIIVDPHNKLKIIDAVLLEGKTVRPIGFILEIFTPLILARQNYLIRQFIK